MHDVAYLESNGIPTVALVSDQFKPQLAYQASMLGLEQVRVQWVQHPIQCNTKEEIWQKAVESFAGAVQSLTSLDASVLHTVSGAAALPIAFNSLTS